MSKIKDAGLAFVRKATQLELKLSDVPGIRLPSEYDPWDPVSQQWIFRRTFLKERLTSLADIAVDGDVDDQLEQFVVSCLKNPVPNWKQKILNWLYKNNKIHFYDAQVYANSPRLYMMSASDWNSVLKDNRSAHTALDVGAGKGDLVHFYKDNFSRIVCMETSKAMCRSLQRQGYIAHRTTTATYEEEKVSEDVDIVFCLNTIDRCTNPKSLLENIRKLVPPGAPVIISVPLPYCHLDFIQKTALSGMGLDGDNTFESSAEVVAQKLLIFNGFQPVSLYRYPYISSGPLDYPLSQTLDTAECELYIAHNCKHMAGVVLMEQPKCVFSHQPADTSPTPKEGSDIILKYAKMLLSFVESSALGGDDTSAFKEMLGGCSLSEDHIGTLIQDLQPILVKLLSALKDSKYTRRPLHGHVLQAARNGLLDMGSSADDYMLSSLSSEIPVLGVPSMPIESSPSSSSNNNHSKIEPKRGVLRSPSMSSSLGSLSLDTYGRRERRVSFHSHHPGAHSPNFDRFSLTSPQNETIPLLGDTQKSTNILLERNCSLIRPNNVISPTLTGIPMRELKRTSSLGSTITERTDTGLDSGFDSDESDSPNHQVTETKIVRKETDADGGKFINQYLVIQEIGRGSFGKVKLVQHVETDKYFAIKILNKSLLKKLRRQKKNPLESVQTEIAILKKLRHKNVVSLYEVIDDEESDKMYMVLEYAVGGCVMRLSDDGRVKGAPHNVETAKKWFRDLLSALKYSHRNGVFHRDIKPENLLLDGEGNLKLCDFGVSTICHDGDDDVHDLEGTPAFLAPEALDPQRSKDGISARATDVWALGITLYLFVFGKLPFNGTTRREMAYSIRHDEPVFPEVTLADGQPTDVMLVDLLTRLLVKEPLGRSDIDSVQHHPWVTGSCGDLTPLSGCAREGRKTPPDSFSLGSPTLSMGGRTRSDSRIHVSNDDITNAITKGSNVTLRDKVKMIAKIKRRMSFKATGIRTRMNSGGPDSTPLYSSPTSTLESSGDKFGLNVDAGEALISLIGAVACTLCADRAKPTMKILIDSSTQTLEWDTRSHNKRPTPLVIRNKNEASSAPTSPTRLVTTQEIMSGKWVYHQQPPVSPSMSVASSITPLGTTLVVGSPPALVGRTKVHLIPQPQAEEEGADLLSRSPSRSSRLPVIPSPGERKRTQTMFDLCSPSSRSTKNVKAHSPRRRAATLACRPPIAMPSPSREGSES